MQAISSYRGNRPTNTHTHTQTHPQTHADRPPARPPQTGPITIHCAAKLSAQCKNGYMQDRPACSISLLRYSSCRTLTGLGDMRQRREALLDGRRDGHHGEHEGQTDIAQDGTAHQTGAVVVADEICDDEHGRAGRPRYQAELSPEPAHDHCHVEAEYERQRDEVAEVETVHGHRLKRPVYIIYLFI